MVRGRVILPLCLCVLLTGCAGRLLPKAVNIAEVELVRTIAVDAGEGGEISLTVCGDLQKETTGGETRPPVLLNEKAETLFGAVSALDGRGEGRLEYGHVEECVIGEALAKAGISPVCDYLERDGSVRTGTKLFLLKGGTGEQALRTVADANTTPTQRLTVFSENRAMGGDHWPFLLRNYLSDTQDNGAALLPVLELQGKELVFSGLGWMEQGRLGGYFTREESRGVCLLAGYDQKEAWELELPEGKAGVQLVKSQCRFIPEWDGERLAGFTAKLEVYGKVTQLPEGWDANNQDQMEGLRRIWLDRLQEVCAMALQRSQQEECDFLHLRRTLVCAHPLWQKQIDGNWKYFPELQVKAELSGELGRTYDTGASAAMGEGEP